MEERRLFATSAHAPSIAHANSKYLKIMSAHYSYIETSLEMPKQFYVTLHSTPPKDLRIGALVRLHISAISSQFLHSSLNGAMFKVSGISGMHVILEPDSSLSSSLYGPLFSSESNYKYYYDSPFGWGIDTTFPTMVDQPNRVNVKYGFGIPIGFLEYTPVKIADWWNIY